MEGAFFNWAGFWAAGIPFNFFEVLKRAKNLSLSFLFRFGVLWFACSWASSAFAHGRPPSIQQLHVDPNNPLRIVGQATWGMVFSEDGGESWTWTCAAAYGVDARMEDPNITIGADGTILTGTFNGAFTSGVGCEWDREEAFGDTWVVAMDHQDTRTYAVETRVFEGDRLWRLDEGVWSPQGETLVGLVMETMVIAPSDPDTVYLGGLRPRTSEQERGAFIVRSTDGGETLQRFEVSLRNEEFSVHVLGVEPDDPERVWAVVRTFDGEMADERVLRSTNGGRNWDTRVSAPQVGGFAITPDGRTWVGSRLGGLWVSEDDGRSWRKAFNVAVRCLTYAADQLWVCTDQSVDGFALGIVRDAIEPVLQLESLTELRSCEQCSETGVVCPAWIPDVAFDLGLDYETLGIDPPELTPDGGVGLPRDPVLPEACGGPPIEKPGGCGCSTPGSSSPPSALALVAFVYWRRRMKAKPSSASKPSPLDVPAA